MKEDVGPRDPQSTPSSLTPFSRTPFTHTRRPAHTPKAVLDEKHRVHVLTLETSKLHRECMDGLRDKYFPPNLNRVGAHVCLFHALPDSKIKQIEEDILALAASQSPFRLSADRVFQLARGAAIGVDAPEAEQIHTSLRTKWIEFLSKQDGHFKAHYTIQNKASEAEAKTTVVELEQTLQDLEAKKGTVIGLTLWEYKGGFWRNPRPFRFQGKCENEQHNSW